MKYYKPLGLLLCLFLAGCATTNENRKAAKSKGIQLDEIEIVASRDNPYRAAATQLFDLQHTRLEVRFDYENTRMNGKAWVTAKPHFYPQQNIVLDAKNFDIAKVEWVTAEKGNVPLAFTYDSLQLNIDLGRTVTATEKVTLYIEYTAKPNERKTGGSAAITDDRGLYFINPDGKDSTKPIQIWTQGETESSSCWFPTIDKPNQKSTQELYITRKKEYVSLSNGLLQSSKDNGDGTVTDYWKMTLPHAPYLFMMAVGEFAVVKDRWRDILVDYYVEKEYENVARKIFGNTPQMMEFFSQKLGFEYPWPKYSQVIVRDFVSGAMENTSATLHGEFVQRNSRELLDETHEDIVSHELMHQWFGDVVTCESWSNLPLNESFATYGEYLWNEYKYGKEFADYKLYENYESYLGESEVKNVDLVRFYYDNKEDMFDRHSYEKGGLVLHYLRNVIGDDAFFKSLQLYLNRHQFKTVEMHQLRLAVEEITGRDMNWFFNQWFFNNGHPILSIQYSYTADSVFVTISQKQNTEGKLVYTLPMNVMVHYDSAQFLYPIELKRKEQVFAFKAMGKPVWIDADPERVVLCEREENKTTAQYVLQFTKGSTFGQRYQAFEKLAGQQKESVEARNAIAQAVTDSFFVFRREAIAALEWSVKNTDSLLPVIDSLACLDVSSKVRRAGVEKLSKAASAAGYVKTFTQLTGDSSYQVAAASLKALQAHEPKTALSIAKQWESEKNMDIQAAVADVYSKEGDAGYDEYFKKKLAATGGFGKYYLFYYYANFLTRMEKPLVLKGIETMEQEGMATQTHYLTQAAKGAVKRVSKWFDDKKKKAQAELSKETNQTAKLNLQEQIRDYDEIISAANDAAERLSKKK